MKKKPGKTDAQPQNKRKTGGKRLFGAGIDPAVGKATQIQPGEVRNPGGRPSRKLITEAIERLLPQPVPKDPLGRTWADLIAEGQMREAVKGNTAAANFTADRHEGRPMQPVELSGADGEKPLEFNLNIRFRDPAEKLEKPKPPTP